MVRTITRSMTGQTDTPRPQRRGRRWRGERGQALIEFALAAPVLILLLLGLFEFGRGLNSYLTVITAARDAARLGAQIGASDTSQLKTLVDNEMSRLGTSNLPLSCSGPSICIKSCTTTNTPCTGSPLDKWMTVKVCYDHSMIVSVPLVGSGPIHMCSQTKIRIAI